MSKPISTKQAIDDILSIVIELKENTTTTEKATNMPLSQCECKDLKGSVENISLAVQGLHASLKNMSQSGQVATKSDDGSFSVDIDTEHLKDEIADSIVIMIKETVFAGIKSMIEEENKKLTDEIALLSAQNRDLKERLIDLSDDVAILKLGGSDLKSLLESKSFSNSVPSQARTTTTSATNTRAASSIPSYLYRK